MRDKTLILEDQKQKNGYTCVPNAVMVATGLSIGAKMIYGLLLMFAWQDDECFPGQERLAAAASISVRQVQRYLVELKEYGLITWRCRGQNQTNIYYIRDVKKVERLKIPDTTDMSCPDATYLSYKEDSDQNVVDHQEDRNSRQEKEVVESPGPEPDPKPKADDIEIVQEIQEVARSKCNTGLPGGFAARLLKEYPPERIVEKIELIGAITGQIRNLPGFLFCALRDNYVHMPVRSNRQHSSNKRTSRAGPGRAVHGKKYDDLEWFSPEQRDEIRKKRRELMKSLYIN